MRFAKAASALREELEATRALDGPTGERPVIRDFARDLGLELDVWQEDVVGGDWKRALLNVTRQGGKSTVAALLGLYEALFTPNSLTLIVSPSDRQSGELFRKLVALREHVRVPYTLLEDTKRSMTVAGGGRVASLPGSEATIRGFSAATLIIEDEASRVEDDLYLAVRPMLATTNGRLLLMSTPFGKRGHFWREWTDGKGWTKVRVPATEIERIDDDFLEEERHALGSWWFEQEYLCEFKEADDAFFRADEIEAALTDDVEPLFERSEP